MGLADVEIAQDDVDGLNNNSVPEASPSDLVATAIDKWFSEKQINPGEETQSGYLYYYKIETVSVNSDNPAWVKARQLAFEKALLSIQASFIGDMYSHSITKTLSSMSSNNSSDNREFEDKSLAGKSRVSAIWDKALAAGEAQLDKVLIENGMDPSEFDAVPPAERKDLFTSKYITHSITRAMGDSSGILPIKTFEGNDSKGTHAVGVIAAYSPKFKQLAYDIAHGRESSASNKKGKPIASWYQFSPEVMAQAFGLRVGVDENGGVVLISFGQWGYSYQGTNQQAKARSQKVAGEQAEAIANSQITNFINSRLSLNDESKRGEVVESYLQKQGDDITEKDITNIVDEFSQRIEQTSSGSIAGIRTVSRWSYQHPYGQEIIGRVRVWTRQGYVTSQNVKNFKPSTASPSAGDRQEDSKGKAAGVSESPDFADPEEFF